VRICHAKGPLVDTLMREGKVPMPEGQDTWERLRASGKGWKEILSEIRMPHMALLRNLRGIFSEVRDPDVRREALELLERGVKRGKQFPFRYLSAWKAVSKTGQAWTNQVKHSLESCIDRACENLPALPGRCAFLTDNSGSAWGTCTSEWGTMQVAEIGNLSAVIGAMRADEGDDRSHAFNRGLDAGDLRRLVRGQLQIPFCNVHCKFCVASITASHIGYILQRRPNIGVLPLQRKPVTGFDCAGNALRKQHFIVQGCHNSLRIMV
jgi:hypothetical protein